MLQCEERASADPSERRGEPRLQIPFPATVRGVDANGQSFEDLTRLRDLSGKGLYVNLTRPVDQGKEVFLLIQQSTNTKTEDPVMCLAVYGKILRLDQLLEGDYGAAVVFMHPPIPV